jgi:hypothetical protein
MTTRCLPYELPGDFHDQNDQNGRQAKSATARVIAMRTTLIGVTAFLLASVSTITTAFCQSVTVLSQVRDCSVTTTPNVHVTCRFNVLIIDPHADRRVSCDFAMGIRYQTLVSSPEPERAPFNRLIDPVFDTNISQTNCFIQPGLDIPHPSIFDVSSRTNADIQTKPFGTSANAYIIYTANKVTFCMNAGTLYDAASETLCKDADLHPFR